MLMLKYIETMEVHRDAQGGYIGVVCNECQFEGYVDDKYNLNQLIEEHRSCRSKKQDMAKFEEYRKGLRKSYKKKKKKAKKKAKKKKLKEISK